MSIYFCAIIFLGYIFCDVVLLSPIRKILGDEFADKMFNIGRRSKRMPLVFVLLIVTGLAMLSRYVGGEMGYFATTLQQFLMIKILLVFGIALMIVIFAKLAFYF